MFRKRAYPLELAYRLVPISQGPKNLGIPGPNPLKLPHVMYMHASKTLCTGLYKSQVHKYLLCTGASLYAPYSLLLISN